MAKVRKESDSAAIRGSLALARQVARFPARKLRLGYGAEADVLYISFHRPQKATETVEDDDGMLLRYRGKQLVGVTVLDASKR